MFRHLFDEVANGEKRPGRPRKLTDEELNHLQKILPNPPTEAGYEVPAWTTDLVQELIRDRFEIPTSVELLTADVGGWTKLSNTEKSSHRSRSDEGEEFDGELKNR